MSYNQFQLTEAEIDRIKAKNAKKAIRAYIKQHGSEPNDISSYYTATNAELEHYRSVIYAEQMTSGDGDGGGGETHDYSQDYFTIESLEDNNTIDWEISKNSETLMLTQSISVSTDNGATWTDKTLSIGRKNPITIVELATLSSGQKILIKGSNTTYASSLYDCHFKSTGNFNVEGNIMSLIYGDNFIGQTTLDSAGYNFMSLFYNCSKLIFAENLILSATTLAANCYANMFRNCTLLTSTPELPATTLAERCYSGMFQGCTSLNYIKCLATDISANACTNNWVSNVAASGTFVKNASMSSWTTGANGIPSGWTVQDAA